MIFALFLYVVIHSCGICIVLFLVNSDTVFVVFFYLYV